MTLTSTFTRNDSEQGRSYTIAVPARTVTLPSVTTILKVLDKPALPNWAAKMTREGVAALVAEGVELPADQEGIGSLLKERGLRHMDKRDSAAERGTATHAILEQLCEGVPVEPINAYQEALCSWWDERQPAVVHSEITVYSLVHGFAGTADLILVDSLVDLKTGNARRIAYESDFLQVAAYRLAYREMTGFELPKTGVLICKENGKYAEFFSPDPDADERAFCDLLKVWRWREAISHH